MATGKRYYWIKLRDNFFDDDGPADYLMSQENGANYVVLYQMLCLKTINTNGRLSNRIGEILIPYDVEKIRRTCKYFTADTIRVAMNLYGVLGLIYEDRNNVLTIADFKSMVGSESDYAAQKSRQRMRASDRRQLPADIPVDEGVDIPMDTDVDKGVDTDVDKGVDADVDKGVDIVHTEIRDKEIKSVESETLGEINKTPKRNNSGSNKQSVSQTRAGARGDGLTDGELQTIIENCELEIFPAELQKIFTDAIERLYYSEELKVGKAVLPQANVRSRLHLLNNLMLQEVQHKLETNTIPIKNPTAYIMTTIYTNITEYESSVLVAPELHDEQKEG